MIENNENIITKLAETKKFLQRYKGETEKVLDIGGTSRYYEQLKAVFSPSIPVILNIDPQEVEGIPNSIIGDATKMEFPNEIWDIITCYDIIEHLIEPADALSEIKRILKQKGLLILSSPNLASIYSRFVFLFGYTPYSYTPSKIIVASPFSTINVTGMTHKSVFTHRGLKELLLKMGFEIAHTVGFTYAGFGKDSVGFYKLRRDLNYFLPSGLREGTLLFCIKK